MNRKNSQGLGADKMSPPTSSVRRGFTLVEMLVVISIVTVLAALLVPAVYSSISKAKEARVAVEIANITKALEQYKLDYGEYPPDFSWAAAAKPTERGARAQILIDNHLSRIFRRRVPAQDLPVRARPATTNPQIDPDLLRQLDPTTALHFWLKGFYADPQFPLFGNPTLRLSEKGSRSPVYDFDQTRLMKNGPRVWGREETGTAFTPEPQADVIVYAARYYPQSDDLMSAIVYYNSASYSAPIETSNTPNLASDHPDIQNPAVRWAQSTAGWPKPVAPPYISSADVVNTTGRNFEFAARDKFQLIWAGFDGQYIRPAEAGKPGFYDLFELEDPATYGTFPNGGPNVKKAQRDNITSFGGGQTLGDSLPD